MTCSQEESDVERLSSLQAWQAEIPRHCAAEEPREVSSRQAGSGTL